MDEQRELDSIHEKVFQLCKELAHLRKIPMPERVFENEVLEEFTFEGGGLCQPQRPPILPDDGI